MQITCPECKKDELNICQGDYEANVHCLNCDYCMDEPITIEESEAMIIQYETNYSSKTDSEPHVCSKCRWISIKDKLPDAEQILVFTHRDNEIAVLSYHNQYWSDRHGYYWDNISHWMPLPEPPKQE